MAKANQKETEGVYVKTVLGVKSFRRAGFEFNEQSMGFALDALSEEQLKALKEEPNLIVEHVTFNEGDAFQAKA